MTGRTTSTLFQRTTLKAVHADSIAAASINTVRWLSF